MLNRRYWVGAAWLLLFLVGCAVKQEVQVAPQIAPLPSDPALFYSVDLTSIADDRFKVTLLVNDLEPENEVYQFASTAPGTYQVMDIGRFVSDFTAFSDDGSTLPVERISTNQWRLSSPREVAKIQYKVAETWDTPVEENSIYPMAGSSIEEDHVLINGQTVFGYPTGMQGRPLRIQLTYPDSWLLGTALHGDQSGALVADNFDHVVDSPILLGNLTYADVRVGNCDVRIFTYSKTGKFKSAEILDVLAEIIKATDAFLDGFPVDRYTFLYHFEDIDAGAWEHSFSSFYVASEDNVEAKMKTFIPDTAAHEIFHMVTPLHIHSDVISPFNFVEPNASEHIWFYEGTTEWASKMMQYRGGLINLEGYLADVTRKLQINDVFDPEFSISDLSLQSYTPKGQSQWPNIYNRGAVIAGLLDIHLLERSGGTRGLREVIQELTEKYGPNRAFPEQTFFKVFTGMTYPEVEQFMEDYIRDTKTLPVAHYFDKLGIDYTAEKNTGEMKPHLGFGFDVRGSQGIFLKDVSESMQAEGLQSGDKIVALNEIPFVLANAGKIRGFLQGLKIDDSYELKLSREGSEIQLKPKVGSEIEVIRHLFSVREQATQAQLKLRQAWSKNL